MYKIKTMNHISPCGLQKLEERGIFNRVVAVSADQIVDYDINVALAMHKTIDTKMIDVANTISI